MARSLKARGYSFEAILATVKVENVAKVDPPMGSKPHDETVDQIVTRAWQQPDRPEFAPKDAKEAANGEQNKNDDVEIVRLADVEPEPLTWLWRGRIPLRKLTVLEGDPGLGKSTIAFDLMARVSTGAPMPDGSPTEAGGGVILTAEDGLGDTVRPRLDVAGADVDKIVALKGVRDQDGKLRIPTVEDIAALTRACEKVEAKIVVIDPLMAYLPSQRNSWRDQDVRQALTPLAKMAEEIGVAVVAIRHLNKSVGTQAIYRGGGSIGIVGAARSALLVAKDPEDHTRKVMACIKINLASPPPSLAYRIDQVTLDGIGDVSKIVWEGESPHTADALLAVPVSQEERSALGEAKEFLRETLSNGQVPAKKVQRLAEKAGIADKTLQRARKALRIQSNKGGFQESWVWSLPEDSQDSAKVVNQKHDHLRSELTIFEGEEVIVL
jgi:hypothetical protein